MESELKKEQKPKRQLTPEQLEKLKLAREKALEVRRKNIEMKKQGQEVSASRELRSKPKSKPKPKQEEVVIEMSSSSESESEVEPEPEPKGVEPEPEPERPPPRKLIIKSKSKPPPPASRELRSKTFVRKVVQKPASQEIHSKPKSRNDYGETDDLYSKANMEILKNKLYQQTRQRLMNDIFNY